MNRISRNIAIILGAERMIVRRNMAVLRNQTGIMVLAALIGAIGLVMLNIAAFTWLKTLWSPPMAALAVALVNLALAGLLLVIATRMSAAPGLEPVIELRDMALKDLEGEMQGLVDEVRDMGANVRRMARNPLGSALPGLLVPLISALLKSLRQSKGQAKPPETGD